MAKASSPKGKRLHKAAQERKRAASQSVPAVCDVLVAGAGAAGLAAAVAAKRARPDASVVLLEAGPELGRPILATGNGRCNFSNEDLSPERYNEPVFAVAAMGEEPEDDVKRFFSSLGLLWAPEEGRLYPRSRSAASVRDVLLAEAERLGVVGATLRAVTAVEPRGGRWAVAYEERFRESGDGWSSRETSAASLVVATGGGALGPVAALGLPTVPLSPVLCALALEPSFADALDGRRAHCTASLRRQGLEVARQPGEVLFRAGALSGIAAFDLSRFARPGDRVELDLVPELREAEVEARLRAAKEDGRPWEAVLAGLVDPAVGAQILAEADRRETSLASRPATVARLIKRLPLFVTGLAQTERAQVTRGGVAVSAVDPATMACPGLPGLFLAGEVLDVDGACGGYNLAFAWLSGLKAGASAARRLG